MSRRQNETPMMKQYQDIKKQYPDAFLFYRLGDFYEMFGDDAVRGSQLLELTLTTRNRKSKNPVPMCGVPHHAVQNYIDILIDKGFKVAICEQMEDPKLAKGMVKREVIQLVTPGTNIDMRAGEAGDNNYLTAVHEQDGRYGFAYVDLSTGELRCAVLEDVDGLVNEMAGLRTREVVVDAGVSQKTLDAFGRLCVLVSHQDDAEPSAELSYASQDIESELEQEVLNHLLTYVVATQKRTLSHLQKAVHYEPACFLKLDHYARRNLELLQNARTGKKAGTLLWLLDETKTAMGARMLKQWIARPLIRQNQIREREKIVADQMNHYFERSSLQDELKQVYDLERLAGRVAFGSVNGRDLVQLRTSLSHIPQIRYVLEELNGEGIYDGILERMDPVRDVFELLDRAVDDDPPVSVTEGGVIRAGYNEELDRYTDAMRNGKKWLAELEASEREKTGIHNLKIGFNRVFGYYIEVSKANIAKLPEGRYERKQTLVNAERFITPELKEKEDLILGAESKAFDLEYRLFVEIREKVGGQIARLQKLASAVAELDCLQSFADVSEDNHFVCPELSDGGHDIEIRDGWHPVVERVLGRQSYVPNDVLMPEGRDILLITGPNMSGKSTYMRQLALTVIMAQIGCFVPAKSARLPVFDQIFTRIGAADDLISGESTFMVEMKETNEALKNATENSLLLFDEIGRGTATYDGMALAQAIIEYVHDRVGAKTLFSTHYHELTALDGELGHLENIHVGAVERNGELVFLHKMQEGPADKSYGIHVARLAGMPESLLERADVILKRLEGGPGPQPVCAGRPEKAEKREQEKQQTETRQTEASAVSEEDVQLSLFAEPEEEKKPKKKEKASGRAEEIAAELEEADLMSMTPMDVMLMVYKWQQKMKKG